MQRREVPMMATKAKTFAVDSDRDHSNNKSTVLRAKESRMSARIAGVVIVTLISRRPAIAVAVRWAALHPHKTQ